MLPFATCEPEGTYSTSKYFENTLDGIQGALIDIGSAKNDLDVMEKKLEAIVDGSSMIFKAEIVLENAVAKDVYENAWKESEEDSSDDGNIEPSDDGNGDHSTDGQDEQPSVECKDKDEKFCPSYVNIYGKSYFCSQAWVTDPNGRYYCQKTCDLC